MVRMVAETFASMETPPPSWATISPSKRRPSVIVTTSAPAGTDSAIVSKPVNNRWLGVMDTV